MSETVSDKKIVITGKTLVITDLHIGLKKANQSRLSIIVKVFKNFLKAVREEKISNVICCGDVFHSRIALDLQALNVGLKLIRALSEKCKCYLILGNHDMYYKADSSVNSSNVFKDIDNVTVIDETTEADINGQKALLVPWLGSFKDLKRESYDLMFGHFDVDSKYLIASYIEEHANGSCPSSADIQAFLSNDDLLNETSDVLDIRNEFANYVPSKTNSGDLIGSFVDYVKKFGTIYAGHIHEHKEFVAKSRRFIFVGSPYQQNFGEIDSDCGFYVLNEKNERKFFPTIGVPKHVKIKMSDVLKAGVDSYDFSTVRGNIVKKVYDVDVDLKTDYAVNQRIADSLPFEEALSDYEVAQSSDNQEITNESLETIKKSKLEYIRNYIDSMNKKTLEESGIDGDKLYKMLESYFKTATENI